MKIESFEIGCEKLGLDPGKCLPDVSNVPERFRASITAHVKLCIITEAANEQKQFDWNDSDQEKWYPWFDLEKDEDINPSAFRFVVTCYDLTYAFAGGGSRLCFFSDEDATYHGQQHVDLYRELMVLPAPVAAAS